MANEYDYLPRIGSQDYADLCEYQYKPQEVTQLNKEPKIIGQYPYKIVAHVDKPSGYQGTLYERVPTGEMVIVHRGTEFDRQPGQDGLYTDGSMAINRYNPQFKDADEFTKEAIATADRLERQDGIQRTMTTAGHSLGGAMAQFTAYKYGLKGETFNAYGAAGLLHGVSEGGHQVINHMTGLDPVRTASR